MGKPAVPGDCIWSYFCRNPLTPKYHRNLKGDIYLHQMLGIKNRNCTYQLFFWYPRAYQHALLISILYECWIKFQYNKCSLKNYGRRIVYMVNVYLHAPTNQLVAEASISYVEHAYQTLAFSHHVINEERHLGNYFSGFIHKNKRVVIIWCGPLRTPQNCENCEN